MIENLNSLVSHSYNIFPAVPGNPIDQIVLQKMFPNTLGFSYNGIWSALTMEHFVFGNCFLPSPMFRG